jgi:hypothetical protein
MRAVSGVNGIGCSPAAVFDRVKRSSGAPVAVLPDAGVGRGQHLTDPRAREGAPPTVQRRMEIAAGRGLGVDARNRERQRQRRERAQQQQAG